MENRNGRWGEWEKGRRKDARHRTQGKPEGEIGGVGEREKEGRKTQDARKTDDG